MLKDKKIGIYSGQQLYRSKYFIYASRGSIRGGASRFVRDFSIPYPDAFAIGMSD